MEIEVFDSTNARIIKFEERINILKAWIRWVIETQRLNTNDEASLLSALNFDASYPPKTLY